MWGWILPTKVNVERVDEFLTRMPIFVGRPERLAVLLATHNGITGVPDGQSSGLLGGRLDLTVHVGASDGLMPNSEGPGNAQDAQAGLERRTRLDGTLYDLAIVYVGHAVFDRALQFARSLKHHGKASRVVVLTCGCDIGGKTGVIDPLLQSGQLDAAAWTTECGGHTDMRAILDRLEACFPPKAK